MLTPHLSQERRKIVRKKIKKSLWLCGGEEDRMRGDNSGKEKGLGSGKYLFTHIGKQ
jgi:hypothetical protein